MPDQIKRRRAVAFDETPEEMDRRIRNLTFEYLDECGLIPTQDAVEQMTEVFLKCLAIMCDRPWSPDGSTWQRAGRLGILADVRKKFERLWERLWRHGELHDDSAYDLINYVGMCMRAKDPRWGDWGEPGVPKTEDE